MRKYKKYVGVDVSKGHLDMAEYLPESDTMRYLARIDNTPEAIEEWISRGSYDFTEAVVCLEHTGIYINFLVAGLAQHHIATWVQNALHIKRSMGIQKGKNDKIDAKRIAKYAYRCEDECHLYVPTIGTLHTLKILYHTQAKIKQMLAQLQVPLKETNIFAPETHEVLEKFTTHSIEGLKTDLKKLQEEIAKTIAADKELQKLHTLITTVTGIGKEIATLLLIVTNGFTRFKNVKQLASYAGVAPFENSSGTRTNPDHISALANKYLKRLLYMGALVTLKTKEDLAAYYHQKRKQGKQHKVVMNALCNKILQRIWAVVNSGKDYKKKEVEFEKFENSKSKKNKQEKIKKNLQIS